MAENTERETRAKTKEKKREIMHNRKEKLEGEIATRRLPPTICTCFSPSLDIRSIK